MTASLGGRPLVVHAMEALRGARLDRLFVVVGEGDAQRISELGEERGFEVVRNPDWTSGQSTSVLAGLDAAERAGCGAAVFSVGDQPLVGTKVYRRLVEARERGASVAVATYGGDGRPRNPALFGREVWEELRQDLAGDEGARSFVRRVLRERREGVRLVECGDVGEPLDVDTREELRGLQARFAQERPKERDVTARRGLT